MAENSDGQEKSEEPTSKRMADSRKKGQVARSRELNTFMMMLFSALALWFMGEGLVSGLLDLMRADLTIDRSAIFDTKAMSKHLLDDLVTSLWMLAPFMALLAVVAIGSSVSLGGFNFSLEALQPKFSKLNPLSGMKRLFGVQGLVELIKAILKVSLLGGISVWLLWRNADNVILLGYQSLEVALANMGRQLLLFFIFLSAALVLIAGLDAPFQWWNHRQQLRMTKQEVRDENKQTEGNPEIKARVRAAQREMAMRRMMAHVPTADVVITNPTHYAVALRYDQAKMGAPIVVAKGADLIAAKIRSVAEENRVPVLASPALARAIFHNTEIDHPIPQGLYVAVAKVLAYVFQLRSAPGTVFSSDVNFEDMPIPDDLRRDE